MTSSIATPPSPVTPPAPVATAPAVRKRGPIAWLAAGFRLVVGVLLCQNLLTSILVVGWTGRVMRRRALREWWRKSPRRVEGQSFNEFARDVPELQAAAAVPRWLVAEEQAAGQLSSPRGLRRLCGSLVDNARRGASGALNVLVWTLPGLALLYLAWVLGWTISFNKVYEQSHLGALMGLSGIALFALAMLYVPTALARQAVTGSAAAFYDWKFNWRLVRNSAWGQLLLAMLFTLLSAPLLIVRMAPYFVGHDPAFAEATDAQLVVWLNGYFFWTGFLLLAFFVVVWRRASVTYARAALRLLRREPAAQGWRDGEKRAFAALGFDTPDPAAAPRKSVAWLAGGLSAGMGLASAWLVWSILAVDVMVAQFFNYIPGAGWLNPPLVLLPWMRYLPPGLVD